MAGDLNQRIPRVKGGNRAAADAMGRAFADADVATAGIVPGCDRPGLDHVVLSRQLTATNVEGWRNDVTGNRLSDHDGALVDVEVRHDVRVSAHRL